jgi:hypothetical protein
MNVVKAIEAVGTDSGALKEVVITSSGIVSKFSMITPYDSRCDQHPVIQCVYWKSGAQEYHSIGTWRDSGGCTDLELSISYRGINVRLNIVSELVARVTQLTSEHCTRRAQSKF